MAGAEVSHPIHGCSAVRAGEAVGRQLDAGIAAWRDLAEAISTSEITSAVERAGRTLVASLADGGTVLVAGNGGSAAIASHVAAEFLGKCILDRAPLPAVNLAESISSLTAIGNDYGYDEVFLRGVLAHGRPGDVYIAMSTSGRSENILRSLEAARGRGLRTIAMVGAGGAHLEGQVDHLLVVPSTETPRIQEVHMLWAHAWCEAVDVLCQA